MVQTLVKPHEAAAPARESGLRRMAIVPAFNEAESIARVVAEIGEVDPDLAVVVVDDGSKDATAAIAERAGATVLRLPFNLGIGGAMQTGYLYALENGFGIAVQVDGDGQHDPRELPRLLAPIIEGRADFVVGTRWAGEGDYSASFARRIGIELFAGIVSLIVRRRVTDTTSGFRAVNRIGIRLFAADYPADYPEVETTAFAHRHDMRIEEVPVQMRDRTGGSSSITLVRSIYYVVKVTLALFIGLFRRSRPLVSEDPQ